MNARTETMVRIHGEILIRHYAPNETDPIALCKKLRRLETKVHRAAEDYSNGIIDSDGWEWEANTARARVGALLPNLPMADLVIDGDPRGYALKTVPEHTWSTMPKDWGGYGLIAPDLTE